MKKLLALSLSLIMCFSCFAVNTSAAGNAARETEDNNTAVKANLITTNVTGVLNTQDDVDYYKFNASKDYFVVDFKTNSGFLGADTKDGWVVEIYDSGMNLLDSATVTSNFTSIRLAFSGIVFIKVVAADTYWSGDWPEAIDYDITVTQTANVYWESENNETAQTANSVVPAKAYTGILYKQSDVDWYKVNVTGDYFTLNLKTNAQFLGADVKDGWKVEIYDSALNLIHTYTCLGDVTSQRLAFSGIIYIKVMAVETYWSNDWPADVEYDVTVNQVVDALWEGESNETAQTANTITCGKTYTGSLYKQSDADWYKVKVSKDYFVVDFGVNKFNMDADLKDGWKVEAYDSSMNLLFSYGSLGLKSAKLGFKGVVYIKVMAADTFWSNDWPNNVWYDLKVTETKDSYWENEPDNSLKKATAIKNGKTYKGNLHLAGDVDYYKLKAPAAGTVNVKFTRDVFEDDGNGFKVEVKNKSGKVIYTGVVDDKTKGSFSNIKVAKGYNYIVISKGGYKAPCEDINYKVSYTFSLAKPSLKKVTGSKKSLKISWNKKSDVDGYQIQYATSKKFKKAKTVSISKAKTVSKTVKKLKAKKTYYVRVRTFKKYDGKKNYSAWSKVKSAKTKK